MNYTKIGEQVYRKLRKSLILGMTSATLYGCKHTKTEYSQIMHEPAIVAAKHYTAPHEDPDTMFYTGDTIIFLPGDSVREKNEVTLRGRRFSTTVDDKVLYNQVDVGDVADVAYREAFKVTYEGSDSTHKPIERMFDGYEFVSAKPLRLQDFKMPRAPMYTASVR